MNCKVSVVIPAYNTGEILRRCLDSVINQTYQNIEIIIIDDGSTDCTGSICDEYASTDARIIVKHKENGGVSSARNIGIEIATGEYVVFIDSDDYVDLDYISTFIELKERYAQFDSIWLVYKCNSCQVANRFNFMSLYSDIDYCAGSPWCKLYSLSIIKDNSIVMPTHTSLGEDLIFNLRYLDSVNDKILLINYCGYHYEKSNNESLSNKYRKNLNETNSYINDILKQYLIKWNSPQSEFELLEMKIFSNYMDTLFNTFNKNNNDSFLKRIKFNNSILNNKEFVRLLDKYGHNINPGLRKLYKTKQYLLVYLALKIIRG